MQFWRIHNNQLGVVGEVDRLGWHRNEGISIPDEYLEKQEFVIMRTCHGIGDWGIISALPRILKTRYPNCKVLVPTPNMLKQLFGQFQNTWAWKEPFMNVRHIFDHNPYVNAYIDSYKDEIFHDHYRVYNDEINTPLVEQLLEFWQIKLNEDETANPEIYWSEAEIELGDKIINEHTKGGAFGTLLLSERFDYSNGRNADKIRSVLAEYPNLKWFYWTSKPIKDTEFSSLDVCLDIRHIHPRIQLYIKSKAQVNVGNQCGVNDSVAGMSRVITLPRQKPLKENFIRSQIYLDYCD